MSKSDKPYDYVIRNGNYENHLKYFFPVYYKYCFFNQFACKTKSISKMMLVSDLHNVIYFKITKHVISKIRIKICVRSWH